MIDPFTAIGTTSVLLDLTITSGKVVRNIYHLSVNSSVTEADKSLGEFTVQMEKNLIQLECQLEIEVPTTTATNKNENDSQKALGEWSRRDRLFKGQWRKEKKVNSVNTESQNPSNRKSNQGTADITPLIRECRRIGNEIVDLLKKTTVQTRSPGAIIKAAFLTVWTEDKRAELRRDLDIVLQQISFHLQVMAW